MKNKKFLILGIIFLIIAFLFPLLIILTSFAFGVILILLGVKSIGILGLFKSSIEVIFYVEGISSIFCVFLVLGIISLIIYKIKK